MKRILYLFFAGLIVSTSQAAVPGDTTQLRAKPIYGREAKVVSYILDNNHYRKIGLNDSLSSVILDQYLEALDNNKNHTMITSYYWKNYVL